jgi:hypothetical protein
MEKKEKGTRPSSKNRETVLILSARKSNVAETLKSKRASILPPNTKDLSKTYNHNARNSSKDAGMLKKPVNNLNVSDNSILTFENSFRWEEDPRLPLKESQLRTS